jgi:hypothetical protein
VYTATITLKQQQNGWQSGPQDIAGITVADPTAGKTAVVKYTESTGATTIEMTS